jgi:hypothetical protein
VAIDIRWGKKITFEVIKTKVGGKTYDIEVPNTRKEELTIVMDPSTGQDTVNFLVTQLDLRKDVYDEEQG